MRLYRLLGERRISWTRHRCHRQLRRPDVPGADHCGVGGGAPLLARSAAGDSAKAGGKAGLMLASAATFLLLHSREPRQLPARADRNGLDNFACAQAFSEARALPASHLATLLE